MSEVSSIGPTDVIERPARSLDAFVAKRRRVVSSCRLRGMSVEEIHAYLEKKGIVDPRTGTPFSKNTIYADAREISRHWQDEMLKDISEHRARVLAELSEVKSAAWKGSKLNIVLSAIDREIGLLGLNELERLSTEIALANLLKGLPTEIRSALKTQLSSKVREIRAGKDSLKMITNPGIEKLKEKAIA